MTAATARTVSAAALAATIVLIALASAGRWNPWVAQLAIWAPLVAAVILTRVPSATARTAVTGTATTDSSASPDVANRNQFAPPRFSIRPIDILLGLFIGLALRTIVSIIELAVYGGIGSTAPLLDGGRDIRWLFLFVLAPVLLGPIIEEAFYRGTLLPAIGNNWAGIAASATIFALTHQITGWNTVHALSTLTVGLVLAIVTVRTGRLGAPIIAHITYNGSLVGMSYL